VLLPLNVVLQAVQGHVETTLLVDLEVHVHTVLDARGLLIPLTHVVLDQTLELFVIDLVDENVLVCSQNVKQLLFAQEGVVLLLCVFFVGQEFFGVAQLDALGFVGAFGQVEFQETLHSH